MRTPVLTVLGATILSMVFAVGAFASSPADVGGAVASVTAPVAGVGAMLEEPATAASRGVGNLPSTSTDATTTLFALGAILMTFGVALLALRFATPRR